MVEALSLGVPVPKAAPVALAPAEKTWYAEDIGNVLQLLVPVGLATADKVPPALPDAITAEPVGKKEALCVAKDALDGVPHPALALPPEPQCRLRK